MPGHNWRRLLKPADIEALQRVAAGDASPSTCPQCKDVPDSHAVVERSDQDEPAPFRAHLRGAGILKRCPTSGALYWQDQRYEYLAGGSEDEYTFKRVSPERAAEILGEWAAEPAPGKPQA